MKTSPAIYGIGNPIVDIPGCVKAHKDNKKHKTGIPIDKDLVKNDSKNAMTLCPDGSYPAYSAMNYEPDQLLMTYETKAPPVAPPPEPAGPVGPVGPAGPAGPVAPEVPEEPDVPSAPAGPSGPVGPAAP